MPSLSATSPSFRYSRTWVRNGPGPKVPHPFRYSMAAIRETSNPEIYTVYNGGASTHVGTVPSTVRVALYEKMRERAYASMQLGADFGEGRQTLSMLSSMLRAVRSPLETVGMYMRKVARKATSGKNFRNTVLKDSADAYLAFTYGVQPLMQSIHDASRIAQHPQPPRKRIREAIRSSYLSNPYFTNNWPKGPAASAEYVSHEVGLSAGFDMLVTNPNVFTLEQLGLLNPLSVAWELVPFSFVVDWFLPIDTYVNSLSDYAGCTFENAYVTEFVRSRGFRTAPNRKPPRFCYDESVKCVRTLGIPHLPLTGIVDLQLVQSKRHVLNALALVTSIKIR